jgi:hypothetical protein
MLAQPRSLLVACSALVLSLSHAEERPIHREKIEWCDVWIVDADKSDQPRVLLIGDSITRAYYPEVAKKLAGKASVSRFSTSSSVGDPALIKQIKTFLTENHFDVIHFNNGMHGWDYTEAEYQKYFPEFVTVIQEAAPKARLIWATTTPVRKKNELTQLDPKTARVKARNEIAAVYVTGHSIPTDDLFRLVESHPDYYREDGVHFAAPGSTAEAAQVAAAVEKLLDRAAP